MQGVRIILVLALGIFGAQFAAADGLEDLPTAMERLIDDAIDANPSLAGKTARVQQLRAMSEVSGLWPDPVVGVEYSNVAVNSFGLNGHPMSGLQFKVIQRTQPLGWSGLRRDVSDARAEVAQFALAEAEWRLRGDVSRTYLQLSLSRMLRQVTEAHLARTIELHGAVLAKYVVGAAGQHTVLRLEVLRDRLADDVYDYERVDTVLSAALVAATGGAPRSFDTDASVTTLPAPESAAGWLAASIAARPEMAGLDAQVRLDEGSAQLAQANGTPRVSVWLGYRLRTFTSGTDEGVDLMSAGVSVPIPTGSGARASAERAAYLHGASASRAALAAETNRTDAALTAILANWQRAASKSNTYETRLLPAARASLETTLLDYTLDQADFSSLYDAEVVLLNLERAHLTAQIETHLQRSAAVALLGTIPTGESQ